MSLLHRSTVHSRQSTRRVTPKLRDQRQRLETNVASTPPPAWRSSELKSCAAVPGSPSRSPSSKQKRPHLPPGSPVRPTVMRDVFLDKQRVRDAVRRVGPVLAPLRMDDPLDAGTGGSSDEEPPDAGEQAMRVMRGVPTDAFLVADESRVARLSAKRIGMLRLRGVPKLHKPCGTPATEGSANTEASPNRAALSTASSSPKVGGKRRTGNRTERSTASIGESAAEQSSEARRRVAPYSHLRRPESNALLAQLTAQLDETASKVSDETAKGLALQRASDPRTGLLKALVASQARPQYRPPSERRMSRRRTRLGLRSTSSAAFGKNAGSSEGPELAKTGRAVSIGDEASLGIIRTVSIADVDRATRPVSPHRRSWLRAMFRYAIATTMLSVRNERRKAVEQARREAALRRKQAAEAELARQAESRKNACLALFGGMASKFKSGAYRKQVLTEDKYRELKQQVALVSGSKDSNPVLSLAEILRLMGNDAGFDPATFRKLDKDHSGYLDLEELLRGYFPSATAREVRELRSRVDAADEVVETRREVDTTGKSLSAESKATIFQMFQACDAGRKGVLRLEDLERVCRDPEWAEVLCVRQFFGPGGTGCMTLDEFTEVVKFGFPPFNGKTGVRAAGQRSSSKMQTIPQFVLDAQEQTTSSVD